MHYCQTASGTVRLNKKIAKELDEDLKQIQLIISNNDEFVHVFNLREKSNESYEESEILSLKINKTYS